MPGQRPLSEQEYNAVVQRVIATAPDGLSEAQFNALIDKEIARAEAPPAPVAGRGTGYSPSNRSGNIRSIREGLPSVGGSVGGALGGVPGAIAGGSAGALGRDLWRAAEGAPETPKTPGAALGATTGEGLKQGLYAKGGELIGRGLAATGEFAQKQAVPMLARAVRPAIGELRRIAGRTGGSLAGETKKIVDLVRRTGLTTPEATETAIRAAEGDVKAALEAVGPNAETVSRVTNPGRRGLRYLRMQERGAGQQMAPSGDPATVAGEAEAFRQGPLFQPVQVPPQTGIGPANQVRVPRANVTPEEALRLARGTSRHQTAKQMGETKGLSIEAQKALERAGREEAKRASPALREALGREGELIRLKPILDQYQLLQLGRGHGTVPAAVGGAEMMTGNAPLIGGTLAALNRMTRRPLETGLRLDRFGGQLQRGAGGANALPDAARLLMALMGQRSNEEQ